MSRAARAFAKRTVRHLRLAAVTLGAVAIIVVGTALPAWAHHPLLSGVTVCSDGQHLITWTVRNSETDHPMRVASATATLGSQTFAVTGYDADLPPSGATSAQTTVPGGLDGTVTLTVHGVWPDFAGNGSTSVVLVSHCPGSTTTTTAVTTTTEATTTTVGNSTTTSVPTTITTSVPSTTTTSISGNTSTTAEATTTTTGTPVVTAGSTATTTTSGQSTPTSASRVTDAGGPSGSLPFTGGSTNGAVFGLLSLVGGAVALALTIKRNQPRGS